MKFISQQGSTIISVLILVIGLAFVLSCYNSDKMPDTIRDILPDNKQSQNNNGNNDYSDDYGDEYYENRRDPNATYTVQVVATTSREEAFAYKRALARDGYAVRVEEDPYGREGLYYKVRVGKFERQSKAVAAKDRILRRYVKHFNDSFVYRY